MPCCHGSSRQVGFNVEIIVLEGSGIEGSGIASKGHRLRVRHLLRFRVIVGTNRQFTCKGVGKAVFNRIRRMAGRGHCLIIEARIGAVCDIQAEFLGENLGKARLEIGLDIGKFIRLPGLRLWALIDQRVANRHALQGKRIITRELTGGWCGAKRFAGIGLFHRQ